MLRQTLLAVLLSLVSVHAADTKTRISLAGDSTVTDKAGWGAAFAKLLSPDVECVNFAMGGRSSKSFRDEGHWKKVIDSKPAFVLIQFGHNDMPGRGRRARRIPRRPFLKTWAASSTKPALSVRSRSSSPRSHAACLTTTSSVAS